VDGIADMSEKRFAVIIDEAHSSQSGTAAGRMNQAMGQHCRNGTEEEEVDPQDTSPGSIALQKDAGQCLLSGIYCHT
jgi:type I site-specific restriction-modification system R (restriction) subunit